MDRNLLIAFALSFLVLTLWSMLQEPPPEPQGQPHGGETQTVAQPDPRMAETPPAADRYPALPPARGGGAPPTTGTVDGPREVAPPSADARMLRVEQPLYRAQLSTLGGSLRLWELREYHDKHGDPVELLAVDDPDPAAATPFVELGVGDLSREIWNVELASDTEVRFALSRNGVILRKTYLFGDEDYGFRLLIEVENQSEATVEPGFLAEWPILQRTGNDFREMSASALEDGELESTLVAGLGGGGFFDSFTGKRPGEPVVLEGEIDWAGVDTPYFLAALFPDRPASAHARFVSFTAGERGAVQVFFDPVALSPGQRAAREYRGYVGPKEVERLEAFSPSAVKSINLGFSIIAPITRAFGWMLAVLHSFIPNYGWSIILLTILVRLATAPLTIKQMKSMERMRRIQPKIKEIQEKFADDRQKQSEAMMGLYRQEKVNPLGGCLPMLLQLPVFIGLFYALRSSIQLRQAPFIGWIDDLSAPDLLFNLPGTDFPIRLLPFLMGGSMFVQQKITPMQMDPAQARMMLILMPVMMTVISYTFPSGLVLYWMMSNVLAIGHQLWIGQRMEPAANASA